MYFEVPRCLRCCFCVPLRYGILIFGYINLLISVLTIGYLIYNLCWPNPFYPDTFAIVHGVSIIETHIAIPLTLYSLELIFTVILIIGSHMKNTMALKIFYYYGLNSAVVTFLMFCVQLYGIIKNDMYFTVIFLILSAIAFTGFVIQVYLIILVKNEIVKLENNHQFSFINHAAKAENTAPTDVIYRNTTVQFV